MPQNKFALARYRVIDSMLRKQKFVKTSAVVEYCRRLLGYSVSKRTIELDLAAMREDELLGFFAPIGYDTSRKAFFYTESFALFPDGLSRRDIELLREICDASKCWIGNVKYCAFDRIIHKLELFIVTAK